MSMIYYLINWISIGVYRERERERERGREEGGRDKKDRMTIHDIFVNGQELNMTF